MSGKITFSGPFFTADIKKTFRQNARDLLEGMAREGQAAVTGAMPRRSGRTIAGVKGRLTSAEKLTAVISQTRIFPWRVHRSGSSAAQYRGGRLEAKQHQFRRTATALRRARALAMADLTKGLN